MKLWARMIANNLHTDLEDPPKVPMITGMPETSRKPKRKESLEETVFVAAKAVAKAFRPPPLLTKKVDTISVSPLKTTDIRSKSYEHLALFNSCSMMEILLLRNFLSRKHPF